MPFYQTAFVLGQIENRFVVGVVHEKCLFIMATTRLYRRLRKFKPNMYPVEFNPEMVETIELPIWLLDEQALTMLEVRQVLASPDEHQKEFQLIVRSLGSSGEFINFQKLLILYLCYFCCTVFRRYWSVFKFVIQLSCCSQNRE